MGGFGYITANVRERSFSQGIYITWAQARIQAAQKILDGYRSLEEAREYWEYMPVGAVGFTAMGYEYSKRSVLAAIRLFQKLGMEIES